MAELAPVSGAFPARSVSVVPTVMTLVESSIFAVGVKVPVQVTPPSTLLTAVSVPFCSVMSLLSKFVTAKANLHYKTNILS